MPSPARRPFAVALSDCSVGVAGLLTPKEQRSDWKREWRAEIWHRWQFLWHAGDVEPPRETLPDSRHVGSFQDAIVAPKSHEPFWQGLREWARSPFTCLGGLGVFLLVTAVLSGGFPATRELLSGEVICCSSGCIPPAAGATKDCRPTSCRPGKAAAARWRSSPHFKSAARPGNSPLLVTVQPQFFDVVGVKPAVGSIPREGAIVLDYRAWQSLAHANPNALGVSLKIGTASYPVAAVLPETSGFCPGNRRSTWLSARLRGSGVCGGARATGRDSAATG